MLALELNENKSSQNKILCLSQLCAQKPKTPSPPTPHVFPEEYNLRCQGQLLGIRKSLSQGRSQDLWMMRVCLLLLLTAQCTVINDHRPENRVRESGTVSQICQCHL